MPGRKITNEDSALKADLLDNLDCAVFDCDGVLWVGDVPIKGAVEFLNLLHDKGKRIIYVSNNSSKSRASYLSKFKKLGFPAHEDNIFSSAYAAAYYIKHIVNLPADKRVYIVGMEGICAELDSFGVKWTGSHEDDNKTADNLHEISLDPTIGAVLLGFDGKINYYKLAKAFYHLNNNPEVLFLATNDGEIILSRVATC